MSRILARQGTRCEEHPHRATEERCDRCGRPFCDECLLPSQELYDGLPVYRCASCVVLLRVEHERRMRESALAYRAAVAARRTRTALRVAAAAVALLSLATTAVFVVLRRYGTAAAPQEIAERAASCGELSRIRSVGAIGAPAPDEVVNVLAYPHRADVRLASAPGELRTVTGAFLEPAPALGETPGTATAVGAPGLDAAVDECDAGWRSPAGVTLPFELDLVVRAEGLVSVQRIALWQDPQAPRAAWIRDFELLASPSLEGNDFAPIPQDRPGRLEPTTEQQWFGVVQHQAMGLTLDRLARGGAQGTGTEAQPDVVRLRRLRLRVLSTHWDATQATGPVGALGTSTSAARDGVALGEIAAYGPDQEIRITTVCDAKGLSCVFSFIPVEVRALAGRPRYVYFVNDTESSHTFSTRGQDRDADVRVEPGQAASIGFTAAGRVGRYDFFCRILDHASQGMRGTLLVR